MSPLSNAEQLLNDIVDYEGTEPETSTWSWPSEVGIYNCALVRQYSTESEKAGKAKTWHLVVQVVDGPEEGSIFPCSYYMGVQFRRANHVAVVNMLIGIPAGGTPWRGPSSEAAAIIKKAIEEGVLVEVKYTQRRDKNDPTIIRDNADITRVIDGGEK